MASDEDVQAGPGSTCASVRTRCGIRSSQRPLLPVFRRETSKKPHHTQARGPRCDTTAAADHSIVTPPTSLRPSSLAPAAERYERVRALSAQVALGASVTGVLGFVAEPGPLTGGQPTFRPSFRAPLGLVLSPALPALVALCPTAQQRIQAQSDTRESGRQADEADWADREFRASRDHSEGLREHQ